MTDDQIINLVNQATKGYLRRDNDLLYLLVVKAVLSQMVADSAGEAEPIHQWRYFGNAAWLDASAEEIATRKASNLAEDMQFRIVYAAPAPTASPAPTDAQIIEIGRNALDMQPTEFVAKIRELFAGTAPKTSGTKEKS